MTASQQRGKIKWSKIYTFSCLKPSHGPHAPLGGDGYSRVVLCNRPGDPEMPKYPSNYVSTTKYNLFTFLPKSLFEQFRRVANIYFLFAAALSLTPLAPFAASSLIAPLVFVVGVSMTKEAIEDWHRFLQDNEVNNRKVLVHRDGTFVSTEWKRLQVGDIVKVEKDHFFPADLLLLSSSFEDGICYVETMNLDGETNLKLKRALDCTAGLEPESAFKDFYAKVNCEDPNPHLYSFIGNLQYLDGESHVYALGPQQVLLRDSKLRNTMCIYGAVIFSGSDTKVMRNATPPPSKRSRIEKKMDLIIYFLFSVLFLLSLIGSIVFGIVTWKKMPHWWYLRPDDTTAFFNPKQPVVAAVLHLITGLLLYGYLIPISLYVSIEIVKVAQAMFINQDKEMYYVETDKPARARTSNLNEELGQVHTILSDKTGTLTCNMMEFLKCSIAGVSYGRGVTEVEIGAAVRQGKMITPAQDDSHTMNGEIEDTTTAQKNHVKGFNFRDERLMNNHWVQENNASDIQLFFRILAVCHTVILEEDETGKVSYEAESPDEGAFVVAARELGFEFYKRTQSSVMVKEPDLTSNQRLKREYNILELLEFSSARKRMSVVVQDEEGNIFLFCKGADSVIFERLAKDGRKYVDATKAHISDYANAGLRTLAVAYRELDVSEYRSWSAEFSKAKTYMGADRDARLDHVSELIERDLILLGATAVEDKLQKGVCKALGSLHFIFFFCNSYKRSSCIFKQVPHCINQLSKAGIKLWVLTGDKVETAINIGFACSLLRPGMIQLIISLDSNGVQIAEATGDKEHIGTVCRKSILEQIRDGTKQTDDKKNTDAEFALIIDGKALNYALEKDLDVEFLQLAVQCSSVICCRMSPKQKALITRLVRSRKVTTLAIGDGANDVGMIQEAHVGVGISGVEGMQATMASDFAIAQFSYLERLLLIHGSWCYKRIALMICYFFYKNIQFGFTLFHYEAHAAFSGQPAYNDWYASLFNVFFTSLPVIAVGVLEQDLSAALKLKFPRLYKQGVQNRHFSWIKILGWMANGVISSLIVFFFTVYILGRQAFRRGGQVSGFEVLGATIYTCVIWTVNCQLALFIKYFTWVQHVCIWGSILLWFLFLVIYGFLPSTISTTAYRVFIEACAPAPKYWLTIILVTVAAIFPSFVYKSFQNRFCPPDDQIIWEFERDRVRNQAMVNNTSLIKEVSTALEKRHHKRKSIEMKQGQSMD